VLIKLKEVRICSIVIGQTEARRHFQVLESISKGIEAPERKDSRTILHDYLEVRRNPREATPPPSIPRILLGYIHTQKMRSATEHLKKRHTNRGHENERNERRDDKLMLRTTKLPNPKTEADSSASAAVVLGNIYLPYVMLLGCFENDLGPSSLPSASQSSMSLEDSFFRIINERMFCSVSYGFAASDVP
jgi:hypothetical protein